MEKESPVKIGIIGIGAAAVIGGLLWQVFKPVDAPTAMRGDGGGGDWLTIITQIGGLAAMIMAFFSNIKKAVPPETWPELRRMVSERSVDVGKLAAIYGAVDKAAIMAAIMTLYHGFMPPIKVDGDVITIDPDKPVDPRVNPVAPIVPATDDDLIRNILDTATNFKQRPIKLNVTLGSQSTLSLEVKTPTVEA